MPPDTMNASLLRQSAMDISGNDFYPRYLAGHLYMLVRCEAPRS